MSQSLLRDSYHALPMYEQRVLQIDALLFHTARKTDFMACILQSNIRMQDGKKMTAKAFNITLSKLGHEKLLDSSHNCAPSMLQYITQHALDPRNYDRQDNLHAVKAVFSLDYVFDTRYEKNNDLYEERLRWSNYSAQNMRALNLAVHQNTVELFNDERFQKVHYCSMVLQELMKVFYDQALDYAWIKTRHPLIQSYMCCAKLASVFAERSSFPPDYEAWVTLYQELRVSSRHALPLFIESRFLQIDLSMGLRDSAQSYSESLPPETVCQEEVRGALAFFEGKDDAAIAHYASAIRLFRRVFTRAEWFRHTIHSVFYLLAFMRKEDVDNASILISRWVKHQPDDVLPVVLELLVLIKQGKVTDALVSQVHVDRLMSSTSPVMPFLLALMAWGRILREPSCLTEQRNTLKAKFEKALNIHNILTAHLYAELITSDDHDDAECHLFLTQISPFKSFRFLDIIRVKQPWEYQIEQLHHLMVSKSMEHRSSLPMHDKRLAWFIDPKTLFIDVMEQKLTKKGEWTGGKAIAMKRFYTTDPSLTYLTAQDKKAAQGIRRETQGWYNQEFFQWDTRSTLNALIGHPSVFRYDSPTIPLDIVKGDIELRVEKREQSYYLTLSHYSETPRVFLEQETPHRYRVIDFDDDAVTVATIISKNGLTVPHAGKEKVLDILRYAHTSLRIHADTDEEDNIPTRAGDATCVVHLTPMNNGLTVTLWVKPFGSEPPYCQAGQGKNNLIGDIRAPTGLVKQKIIRDLKQEKNNVRHLVQNCPTLLEGDTQNHEWSFDSIEASLTVLMELEAYKNNNTLILEWPKGETFKVIKTVSHVDVSLSIKGHSHWFEYDGQINLDQDHSIDMKRLFALLDTGYGRFIQHANGEFIALTDHFKKQLDELRTISEGNRVYHLNTRLLKELADAAHTKSDALWKTHVDAVSAMEKHTPTVPSTLHAELRDYQTEGFVYLSRLAHWGIGACLADDMGLGKTLQAIAVLLEQAVKGPCIVVAPTSVCLIWIEELVKFAPTVNVHVLQDASDRQAMITMLGTMDVLIVSYGLLQQSEAYLTHKEWAVVVLDEAQSIKNAGTKRWKSAMQLKGKCRIALTGTPIENHVGELWSIFQFLNPGLLGSYASFQQKFLTPIEKNNDALAKRALKNLVSPYILRRTKAEVLHALPPKSEQFILIEPTTEEMAFYEALRQKALEKIQQLTGVQGKAKRFSVLAEITRLRQACCHSSLVDESISIDSSKLKIFLETVKNLRENNHKVLVFSQYVRYLSKIRETLDHEEMTYQYLDGSTSMNDRQRAIEAFQAGEGDLFLISLKAGGTGLNLTAADYVIILDPWWNPAVEDQASARAHRLGQQRPVTVYRLIMKHSIEEKIVKLHKDKRDLAADLLSGGDVSGKITEEELMQLITA